MTDTENMQYEYIEKLKLDINDLRLACIWLAGKEGFGPESPNWEYYKNYIQPLLREYSK